MDLFEKTGKMAIGSRLRLLASKITDDSALLYKLYETALKPKWFPVFFVLTESGSMTITQIAQQIGHSQPSVTKIVKEMSLAGLIKSNLRSTDKRRNIVGLTTKGKALSQKIDLQYKDVEAAIENIEKEATNSLWEAIAEWEHLLEQESLLSRVKAEKKKRESRDVKIVRYTPKYKAAFRALNEAWINQYFEMEQADRDALDHPERIIKNGGTILIALYNGKPAGVCALIKMTDPDYDFELAKMAVSPLAQGKHIGWLLGKAIVNAAREAGASKIYLESNTRLKPAISLYYKLGFVKVKGLPSPYKRANIHMELDLKNI